MKIRTGFVSNSSSSSFIIAVPKHVKSAEALREHLFFNNPSKTAYTNPYPYGDNPETFPITKVVDTVWDDIKDQSPKNHKELIEEYDCGYTDAHRSAGALANYDIGVSDHYDLPDALRKEWWNRYNHYKEILTSDKIKEFMESCEWMDANYFVVEYSDNDGAFMSAMEHGDWMEGIPYLKVSKH